MTIGGSIVSRAKSAFEEDDLRKTQKHIFEFLFCFPSCSLVAEFHISPTAYSTFAGGAGSLLFNKVCDRAL